MQMLNLHAAEHVCQMKTEQVNAKCEKILLKIK